VNNSQISQKSIPVINEPNAGIFTPDSVDVRTINWITHLSGDRGNPFLHNLGKMGIISSDIQFGEYSNLIKIIYLEGLETN
jgi:hypothetical protein